MEESVGMSSQCMASGGREREIGLGSKDFLRSDFEVEGEEGEVDGE